MSSLSSSSSPAFSARFSYLSEGALIDGEVMLSILLVSLRNFKNDEKMLRGGRKILVFTRDWKASVVNTEEDASLKKSNKLQIQVLRASLNWIPTNTIVIQAIKKDLRRERKKSGFRTHKYNDQLKDYVEIKLI
jgi:hypothetical protein